MPNVPTTAVTLSPKLRRLQTHVNILTICQDLARDNLPFRRALELACRAGAKYCLQWNDPNNSEWLAENNILYAHTHPPQPNYVIRLDFFSSNPLHGVSVKNKGTAKSRYIGCVALRPGPIRTVVDCSIQPPPIGTTNHYLLCTTSLDARYPVSETQYLSARIDGICPFVQQDAVVGSCAHACLRTVSLILEKRFQGCTSMTIDKIHERTAAMPLLSGSHIPSSGLMEFEVVSALEAMGTQPILYNFSGGVETREHLNLAQVIYPYVESGIPVIVGFETEGQSHAVIVVGHVFDQDSWWQQAELGYFPSLHEGETWIPSYTWVPEFIVQDDNFGPYLSVSRTLLGIPTRSAIVPIPKSCYMVLSGWKAESMAAGYLTPVFYDYVLGRTRTRPVWRNVIERTQEERQVVLRPILITKDALFQHIEEMNLSQQLSQIYREAVSAPWIWLVEVSTPELFARKRKLGEIVFNASYPDQHIKTGLEPLLIVRILDVTIVEANFREPHITSDRNPVSVLVRPTFGKH